MLNHPSKLDPPSPRFNQRDAKLGAALLRGPVRTRDVRKVCNDLNNASRVFRWRNEFQLGIKTHRKIERPPDRDIQRDAWYYIEDAQVKRAIQTLLEEG